MQYFGRQKINRFFKSLTVTFCAVCLLFTQKDTVLADNLTPAERLEIQRAMPVESNQVTNWPVGPTVGAESAILIEAETGTILYSKNIHQKE